MCVMEFLKIDTCLDLKVPASRATFTVFGLDKVYMCVWLCSLTYVGPG